MLLVVENWRTGQAADQEEGGAPVVDGAPGVSIKMPSDLGIISPVVGNGILLTARGKLGLVSSHWGLVALYVGRSGSVIPDVRNAGRGHW